MSKTKYSYKLKYQAICEVKKGKTISQVTEEFNLPYGGSLLRHWLIRYKHPEELLENQDFDNEEQYQKILETKEYFYKNQIQQTKKQIIDLQEQLRSQNLAVKIVVKKANEQITILEREVKHQLQSLKNVDGQTIFLKRQIEKLTKSKQELNQNLEISQKKIGELKFQLYQCENLKTDNLELKRENKKLLNSISKLTRENKQQKDEIELEKMKKRITINSKKSILGSGGYNV